MKQHVTISVLLVCGALVIAGCSTPNEPKPEPDGHAYTPPKDSAERKAILQAVRDAMTDQQLKKAVFVVNYLKVHNGWAWVRVSPQSADGSSHFESQSGLLHKVHAKWQLLEWMPAFGEVEETDPHYTKYFKNLRAKYLAPSDIFPQ